MSNIQLSPEESLTLVQRRNAILRLIENEAYKEVIEDDYFGKFRETLYETAQGLKNTLDEAESLGIDKEDMSSQRMQYIEVVKHINAIDCFYKFLHNSITSGKDAEEALEKFNASIQKETKQ